MAGKRRVDDIEADDLVLLVSQRADQGLAKMAGAACNQNLHARATVFRDAGTFPAYQPQAQFAIAKRLTKMAIMVTPTKAENA
jgi:hypothetical protein